MRVLILKLTSFGDIIHTFSALSEAKKALENLEITWVVDETFAQVPLWHEAVTKIIPCAHRRWRKNIIKAIASGEIIKFVKTLRQQRYDVIIDAQSSIKTGIIGFLARGSLYGYDRDSVREKGTQWFYKHTFSVSKKTHVMDRTRQLFAQSLGYVCEKTLPDAGLLTPPSTLPCDIPENSVVFIPFTTWQTKHWPMSYWQQLIEMVTSSGTKVIIYFAGEHEKTKAMALKQNNPGVVILPDLSLDQRIPLFKAVRAFVGVDTGPTHLGAALNVPGVVLFGPTDPDYLGLRGDNQLNLAVNYPCAKCHKRVCDIEDEGIIPGCFTTLKPTKVWLALKGLLKSSVQ